MILNFICTKWSIYKNTKIQKSKLEMKSNVSFLYKVKKRGKNKEKNGLKISITNTLKKFSNSEKLESKI